MATRADTAPVSRQATRYFAMGESGRCVLHRQHVRARCVPPARLRPGNASKAEMKPLTDERLRNVRAWAAARPDMSGSDAIVGAIDELLARRSAEPPPACSRNHRTLRKDWGHAFCYECGLNLRQPETKPDACETCEKPLPPLAQWSMPSCPKCVEKAERTVETSTNPVEPCR